eukprot:TRINITY_DN1556_c0_g1_i2.p1 TRINITY_DN1556_c0_g1~~TRINITY_DN1556_c0_g1_i2.p1  ORF type:complete len:65 (-),score=0.82 TRINITY_DN1556_c0_g1_i2:46-240(-)
MSLGRKLKTLLLIVCKVIHCEKIVIFENFFSRCQIKRLVIQIFLKLLLLIQWITVTPIRCVVFL